MSLGPLYLSDNGLDHALGHGRQCVLQRGQLSRVGLGEEVHTCRDHLPRLDVEATEFLDSGGDARGPPLVEFGPGGRPRGLSPSPGGSPKVEVDLGLLEAVRPKDRQDPGIELGSNINTRGE